MLYELMRGIGEENLPSAAKHLQGLAVFAKELYLTIHLLKNAALGGDSASESSGGRTPLKSKPQTQVRGETWETRRTLN